MTSLSTPWKVGIVLLTLAVIATIIVVPIVVINEEADRPPVCEAAGCVLGPSAMNCSSFDGHTEPDTHYGDVAFVLDLSYNVNEEQYGLPYDVARDYRVHMTEIAFHTGAFKIGEDGLYTNVALVFYSGTKACLAYYGSDMVEFYRYAAGFRICQPCGDADVTTENCPGGSPHKDCGASVYTGMKLALDAVSAGSQIIVVTGSLPNDNHLKLEVEALAESKKAQVSAVYSVSGTEHGLPSCVGGGNSTHVWPTEEPLEQLVEKTNGRVIYEQIPRAIVLRAIRIVMDKYWSAQWPDFHETVTAEADEKLELRFPTDNSMTSVALTFYVTDTSETSLAIDCYNEWHQSGDETLRLFTDIEYIGGMARSASFVIPRVVTEVTTADDGSEISEDRSLWNKEIKCDFTSPAGFGIDIRSIYQGCSLGKVCGHHPETTGEFSCVELDNEGDACGLFDCIEGATESAVRAVKREAGEKPANIKVINGRDYIELES